MRSPSRATAFGASRRWRWHPAPQRGPRGRRSGPRGRDGSSVGSAAPVAMGWSLKVDPPKNRRFAFGFLQNQPRKGLGKRQSHWCVSFLLWGEIEKCHWHRLEKRTAYYWDPNHIQETSNNVTIVFRTTNAVTLDGFLALQDGLVPVRLSPISRANRFAFVRFFSKTTMPKDI